MSTSLRTRHAARGFSMVELLVTIIIAGIVFAAMVPLFVTVLGKNSADNMRNISAFLAQDKIERLRQLDFVEITQANLEDSAFKSGQFGEEATATTGSGPKVFQVRYDVQVSDGVTTSPSGFDALTEQYKEVSVEVYWDGPPLPVKHVYQVTRIYRQYAGPSLSLDIAPTPDASGMIWDALSVSLTATVPAAWRGTSNGVPLTDRVYFRILLAGVPKGSQYVLTTDMSLKTGTGADTYQYLGNGQYRWTWAGAATAAAGLYRFTAVAYASDTGSAGEGTGLYASLARHAPDPPTGLTATPGVNQVSLSWNPCPSTFFDHFEVWRSTVSGQPGSMIATTQDVTYVDNVPIDRADGTTYYYSLKAVTTEGTTSWTSAACPQVSAMPTWPLTDDTTPPTILTFTAAKVAKHQTITLTWTAVDPTPPSPPSGLDHFAIYRSANGTSWGTASYFPAATATSWADTNAGWATRWYYKIEAYDLAGNFSTSAVKNATTDAQPKYTLTVKNLNAHEAYVWVQDLATLKYYTAAGVGSLTAPAGTLVKKSGGGNSTAFNNLPASSYNVHANFSTNAFVLTPLFDADLSSGAITREIK